MTGLHWPVSVPWKHSGDCTVRGSCISSPNYPSYYGNTQRCNISLPKPSVLRVVDFATEAEYDVLTVNGMRYSGVSGDSSSEPALAVGDVFVLWTDIVWESDYRDSNIGWELCVEPLPSCFDGLSLHPAPVADCPRDGEVSLMDCQTAEPGALCLGGKDCGTRGDINNCYDSLLTHPPTLDVYRKSHGTRRSTATETSTSVSSTTMTTTVGRIVRNGGVWQVTGTCIIDELCISSPNYPSYYGNTQWCNISLPKPSVLRVMGFATEAGYDVLTVNGMRYSGVSGDSSSEPALAVGDVFVLWTDMAWESDYYRGHDSNIGWQLCVEPLPSCFDGLSLHPAPVADCPRDGEVSLMDCQTAEPGALCLGGKDCGTRGDINNCYDSLLTHPPTLDVYRKGNGTTRTTTTSTLTTQTSTSVSSTTMTATVGRIVRNGGVWQVTGTCVINELCISSPNYPSYYGNTQRCNISLPKPSVLRVVDFATEAEYDVLTVNGMRYSGVSGDSSSEPALAVGDVFVLWTDIVWESDYRDSNIGWELCVEPLPSCFDGLSLHPAPVADCPRDGEVSLMDCQTAEPGALCLGGKDCGTRGDINNCYDSLLTHPPTLDVYRKGNGTTRTTTGTTLTTQTSITHTSTTRTLTTQPAPAYLEELCCVQQKLWILDHTIGLQVSVCKSRC